ncbi:hypothetical protein [Sphingomonas sp. SRS2]|uniref:hypothetical protein n=1 Tax=Sphingomonas sp. SRS2 TaxID=133190 RepID=UPI000A42DDCE|nr:hypothetical protein [Sphingomonas sp. SRS2]
MSAGYVLISFSWDPELDHDKVQAVLGRCKDWLRFHGYQYLVYTTMSSQQLYTQLRPLQSEGSTIFITAVDPETFSGWMSQMSLDWLSKPHSPEDFGA